MPICIPGELPAQDVLSEENIFVMETNRAANQDIRPLQVGILNLMPNKIETEVQLLRLLSNTPLQISVDLIRIDTEAPKNTPKAHMDAFYHQFEDVVNKKYDGLIVTGAPLAMLDYEQVKYWDKMQVVMDWARRHVQSTLFLCWAAHAAVYHYFGLNRFLRETKLAGVYSHQVNQEHDELLRGFDPVFNAPHSRFGEVALSDYQSRPELEVLASSEQAGAYIVASKDKRLVFVTGHPEYDPDTLAQEYYRDLKAGLKPALPENYFLNDDPAQPPLMSWRSHGSLLFTNWLNYYVYQITPYNLSDIA
ncbi:homoserine O-acetyltransferase MetA [Lacimicrobium alkaliphilum]|uniref:Homoserine O-succinyltransferase n=1 Tax=Lacimicrobium alkaliphilum TaxID=1526571 RepID=A0A0U3ADQ8_9ALTE|nr:homoserine O-succinyltransferase [Lacimicrobium alkaliphilum]ALS99198.1 homoserine O-succinyltransferase [Lacimicrobium alkaliphilum]